MQRDGGLEERVFSCDVEDLLGCLPNHKRAGVRRPVDPVAEARQNDFLPLDAFEVLCFVWVSGVAKAGKGRGLVLPGRFRGLQWP